MNAFSFYKKEKKKEEEVGTYKLLCFSKMGLLSKAAVNSASASSALNRRIKNITPPRVKTPELLND